MPLSSSSLFILAALAVALPVFRKVAAYRRALASVHHHPGQRFLFNCVAGINNIVPWVIPGVCPGSSGVFRWKYDLFRWFGHDVISYVSVFPTVRTAFIVADPHVLKEIVAARARFPKPVEIYDVLSFYGRNLVASEHEEWKRFRKVSAPSFSERNNKMVWDETIRVIGELFRDVWGEKDEIAVHDVTQVTLTSTLFVISAAGFGQSVSWKDDGLKLPGFQMSFKEAIHHMAEGVFTKAAFPDWLLNLGPTKHMREVNVAYKELKAYMQNMIDDRRNAEKKEDKADLFTTLLDANDEEADRKLRLTDSDLMGNVYVFLIAGHETTGHTLAFAFALLALYPDEQEKLYQHIRTLLPEGEIPKYSDLASYTYANAVFFETLRLCPVLPGIPKISAEDTVLKTTNAAGETVTIPVPAGSDIILDVAGVHYSPRYWDDPHAFKPSRFLEDWPRDAFLAFSGGPRACIGRRFAEIEAMATMILFVSRYRIEVMSEPQYAAETFEERRERILGADVRITLQPRRIPLVFKRR